ncbi:MAG TPA: 23S rRNA (uracil(1939)-C(5))-methyltransferase RlmD, partial [Candidatus Hydrogenedentes bacterium]|nr:23S rRNA (uracil(1939)-C(5))-methyltransferase RlmD [Candidatus Hydrogenedentota bacterium]
PPDSAVIVDPPRAGLSPRVVERLITLAPRNMLYVSCNPSVLARELPAFLESYHLVSLEAVDLFPHTPHVETIATLERRET